MSFNPDQALVRIFDEKYIQGVGFLISRRRIVTCAHVIRSCLNVEDGKRSSDLQVKIDFPLLAPKEIIFAGLEFCDDTADIAILNLPYGITIPADTQSAPVSKLKNHEMSGKEVKLYGFPEDLVRDHWVKGELVGSIEGGKIQIDHTPGTRTALPGFSGTAVWDAHENSICGMVVDIMHDDDGQHVASYMIPICEIERILKRSTRFKGQPDLICYRVDRSTQIKELKRHIESRDRRAHV